MFPVIMGKKGFKQELESPKLPQNPINSAFITMKADMGAVMNLLRLKLSNSGRWRKQGLYLCPAALSSG